MKLSIAVGEVQRAFELKRSGERLTVTDEDGNAVEVRLVRRDGPALELLVDGRRVRLLGHAGRDHRDVWLDGRHRRYRPVKDGAATAAADPGSLSVAIPAVVTEVLVRPGDAVAAGDKLVLLESMKMVLSIQAPQAGTVAAVRCEAGQSVEPGVPLVELEAA